MDQILILFDIDGTLISNSTAGIRAYASAIDHCYGIKVDTSDYVSDGKTDLMIMGELMQRHGIDVATVDLNRLAQEYLSVLPLKLVHDSGSVLPGVVELLTKLSSDKQFVLGLATGNLEKGAQEKLSIHGLDTFFTVGGYGSDATERALVVAAGINKANEKTKGAIRKSVVIGDTPMDVKAAKANNISVLAVATGKFSIEELEQSGADFVVADLTEVDVVIDFLRL